MRRSAASDPPPGGTCALSCLLCGGPAVIRTNAARFYWQTFEYRYSTCLFCGSLTAAPLPDDRLLARVYGPEYAELVREPYSIDSTKDLDWVLDKLRAATEPGVFLDYGCGQGELLAKVAALGWTAVGIEYSQAVADRTAAATGLLIATPSTARSLPRADVVHFGDVVEHLTDPLEVVTQVLRTTAAGAVVLAQGPLEMGPSVFSAAVRPGAGSGRSEVLPVHVIQATSFGQRLFFSRAGLLPREFSTSEVDWPAPTTLHRRQLLSPRALALFGLRRLSRALDSLVPTWGNRYRYEGRIPL